MANNDRNRNNTSGVDKSDTSSSGQQWKSGSSSGMEHEVSRNQDKGGFSSDSGRTGQGIGKKEHSDSMDRSSTRDTDRNLDRSSPDSRRNRDDL